MSFFPSVELLRPIKYLSKPVIVMALMEDVDDTAADSDVFL